HELDERDKPQILVFNKIDAYSYTPKEADDLSPVTAANFTLDDLKNTWMGKNAQCVFISALNKVNFNEFKELVYNEVRKIHTQRFPFNDFLYENFDELETRSEAYEDEADK
nr:hypothetical protein [Breznakibacter sp.]